MVSNFANIKGAQSFKFVVKTIPGQKCASVKVAYFGQQMDLLGKLSTTNKGSPQNKFSAQLGILSQPA